jgi:ketosteroid isomerase-like protein
MNKHTILLTGLVFAFASTACQPPAQQMASGTLSDEDVAAIGDASETFVQAYLAGDWTAVVAMLTENAVWMPPNQPAREGRADIQEWLSPQTVTDFELTTWETGGRSGFAYTRGSFSITFTAEGLAGFVSDTGKYVEIWQKEPDGSWLIDQVIWNSDLPLAAPEPEPESEDEAEIADEV